MPAYELFLAETTILFLYGKVWVRENPYFGIFYDVMYTPDHTTYQTSYSYTVYALTLSWRRSATYRNQIIHRPIVGWFLYDRDLRHERAN